LEARPHDLGFLKISVNQIYCEEESFWQKFKSKVHLDDPIN
jgi:hypothetical protein